jgi:putative DNA primase/helicase
MGTPAKKFEPLTPDGSSAIAFLKRLDADAKGFTFQTYDDNKDRKDERLARVLNGTLGDSKAKNYQWATLQVKNGEGAGVFVTINETDLTGRKAHNVKRVRAYFLDLDGAPLDVVLAWGIKPHIVVESSPGRFQVFLPRDRSRAGNFRSRAKKARRKIQR